MDGAVPPSMVVRGRCREFWLLIPASSVWADEPDVGGTPVALDQKEALRVSQSVIGTIPSDYTFQDREGRPVRLSQYRGKPLLVSFIYTGCFQVCPLTTRSLQKAVESGRDFFGTDQFNIVSIGFNQPADSFQSLKSFTHPIPDRCPQLEILRAHATTVEPLTRELGFSYLANPLRIRPHSTGYPAGLRRAYLSTNLW